MARRQWLQPARKACAVGGNDSLDVSATVDSDDGSPSDKSFSFFFFLIFGVGLKPVVMKVTFIAKA
jgi:hypothetical protein